MSPTQLLICISFWLTMNIDRRSGEKFEVPQTSMKREGVLPSPAEADRAEADS